MGTRDIFSQQSSTRSAVLSWVNRPSSKVIFPILLCTMYVRSLKTRSTVSNRTLHVSFSDHSISWRKSVSYMLHTTFNSSGSMVNEVLTFSLRFPCATGTSIYNLSRSSGSVCRRGWGALDDKPAVTSIWRLIAVDRATRLDVRLLLYLPGDITTPVTVLVSWTTLPYRSSGPQPWPYCKRFCRTLPSQRSKADQRTCLVQLNNTGE